MFTGNTDTHKTHTHAQHTHTHTGLYVHAMLQSAAFIKLFVQFRKKNNNNSIVPRRFPEIPRVAEMLQSRSTHFSFFCVYVLTMTERGSSSDETHHSVVG